jgi:hypothetical protein
MDDDLDQRFGRYREPYLMMAAQARYWPAAPSDGCGNIQLEADELADAGRLAREADRYAADFVRQDNATRPRRTAPTTCRIRGILPARPRRIRGILPARPQIIICPSAAEFARCVLTYGRRVAEVHDFAN